MTQKERSDKRKSLGLCWRCGKPDIIKGELWCIRCKSYYADRRKNRTEEATQRQRETYKKWVKLNPENIKARDRAYSIKLRNDIFSNYGESCACCGEKTREFLTIDHIHGGGNKHRISIFGKPVAGGSFYKKLRQWGYPKGDYQTLCWNCNMARAHHGECPHVRKL